MPHPTKKPGASDEALGSNAFFYQPINPLTVWITSDGNPPHNGIPPTGYRQALLNEFSNETTRVALAKKNAKGVLSFGVGGANAEGEEYSMVVDYIKYMTISIPVRVIAATTPETGNGATPARTRYIAMKATSDPAVDKAFITGKPGHSANSKQQGIPRWEENESFKEIFAGSMPLYVGVGVRVRADFDQIKGDFKVSGLPGLSIEAAAGNIKGNLSVQGMGIGGKEITALMRIPSDLSIASIQGAIESATSIKLKMYDENTTIQPMIIGFESPVIESDVVAELTSFIYSQEIKTALMVADLETVGDKKVIWMDWTPESTPPFMPADPVSPSR